MELARNLLVLVLIVKGVLDIAQHLRTSSGEDDDDEKMAWVDLLQAY